MKIILTIILTILQLFVLVNIQSHAQVVDSPVDYQLTENDSINKNIMKMKGFYYEIREPNLVHSAGVEVETGFEMEWLYVVKSDSVWIDGERLEGSNGWPTYLVVRAKTPKVTVSPRIIKGRALILKGVIDKTDSLIQFYTQDMEKCKRKVDSLRAILPKNRMLRSKEERAWDTVMTMYNNSLYFHTLYTTFKTYKKVNSKRSHFAKFFLSELFNQRNIKFALISVPQSIPLMTFTSDEKLLMKASKNNKNEHGFPAKNRHTKRESSVTKTAPSLDEDTPVSEPTETKQEEKKP